MSPQNFRKLESKSSAEESKHGQTRHDRAMQRAAAARPGKSAFPFEVDVFNERQPRNRRKKRRNGKVGVLYRY